MEYPTMNLRFPLLLLLATVSAVAAAGGCTSSYHNSDFIDTFDGSEFPSKGWVFTGPTPVLDTTAGDPSPSMTWTACPGTNAVAEINEQFDSEFSFNASFEFQTYGA